MTKAFEEHRRELLAYCYRMLGSVQDAEDAVQDVWLAAWQGADGFEGRASLRTWLFRIATNRCLNLLRSARRRPPAVWLEPYPDELLSPEDRYERRETISLAFVAALQTLPPRQVAVLILRDVLGYPASEVAGLLGASVEAVTSALKRARAAVRDGLPAQPPPAPGSAAERELVARFARAFEAGDVDGLLALLTDDIRITMPPMPLEVHGLAAAAEFYTEMLRGGPRYRLEPTTRANGQPALLADGTGLVVLTLAGERIAGITRFAVQPFRAPVPSVG